MRRRRISLLLISTLLAACQSRVAPPVTSATDHVAPPVSVKKVLAVYEGVLPCADCQSIGTALTLFEDSSYRLSETYLGGPDGERTVESEGRWTLRRPLRRDPEGAVYQLDPDQPDKVRSFLVIDAGQILQLDREGREPEPRAAYTLTRKSPPV